MIIFSFCIAFHKSRILDSFRSSYLKGTLLYSQVDWNDLRKICNIKVKGIFIISGLSYINSSTYDADNSLSVENVRNLTGSYKVQQKYFTKKIIRKYFQVGCVINVENWTKWLLGDPVYYFKYGSFLPSIKERLKEYFSRIFPLNTLSEFHSREIFPSHREVTIAVNSQADRFTGTSGLENLELKCFSSHCSRARHPRLAPGRPQGPPHPHVEHPLQPQHLQLLLRRGHGQTEHAV